MFRKLLLWYKKKAPKKATGVLQWNLRFVKTDKKRPNTIPVFGPGNGSWERAVR
jgi:hypothetical protein